MNFLNLLFRSRHSLWLEDQLQQQQLRHIENLRFVRSSHESELARVESLNQTIQFEAMRERVELKKAHAEELFRVIEENQRLKDDLDRFRLLLTPALQTVELPKEREAREAAAPEPKVDEFAGTPFQRMAKQYIAEQEKSAKTGSRKFVKPADAPLPQGESHGVSSERRVDASLGGKGEPA